MNEDPSELLELLTRATGDPGAWGKLLEQYRDRLRTMLELRMSCRLRGRLDPSDVIQETCLEAHQRLEEYLERPTVPFYVWLRGLANQRMMIAWRRHLGTKLRDAAREISLDQPAFPAATSAALAARLVGQIATPSSAAVLAEQKLLLQSALNELDTIDREILILRHFEDLSTSETAAVLGISMPATCNRYVRALARLKSIFNQLSSPSSEFTP